LGSGFGDLAIWEFAAQIAQNRQFAKSQDRQIIDRPPVLIRYSSV
jgi:hypothetical protein